MGQGPPHSMSELNGGCWMKRTGCHPQASRASVASATAAVTLRAEVMDTGAILQALVEGGTAYHQKFFENKSIQGS